MKAGQAGAIVAAFGPLLVAAAPAGPGDYRRRVGWGRPAEPPEESAHFGHRQGEELAGLRAGIAAPFFVATWRVTVR
jgi:hypothetical protein